VYYHGNNIYVFTFEGWVAIKGMRVSANRSELMETQWVPGDPTPPEFEGSETHGFLIRRCVSK